MCHRINRSINLSSWCICFLVNSQCHVNCSSWICFTRERWFLSTFSTWSPWCCYHLTRHWIRMGTQASSMKADLSKRLWIHHWIFSTLTRLWAGIWQLGQHQRSQKCEAISGELWMWWQGGQGSGFAIGLCEEICTHIEHDEKEGCMNKRENWHILIWQQNTILIVLLADCYSSTWCICLISLLHLLSLANLAVMMSAMAHLLMDLLLTI